MVLKAVEITEELVGAGAFGEDTAIDDCDAVFTKLPNVPLFLFTADCVAVGIYDAKHHAMATVHCGVARRDRPCLYLPLKR